MLFVPSVIKNNFVLSRLKTNVKQILKIFFYLFSKMLTCVF